MSFRLGQELSHESGIMKVGESAGGPKFRVPLAGLLSFFLWARPQGRAIPPSTRLNCLMTTNLPRLIILLPILGACQSQVVETAMLDHPLGVSAPAQDWLVDIEFGQEMVRGQSTGGRILFFDVGDNDAAPAIYGGETALSGSALLGNSRLDELKSSAVQDAIQQAGCDLIAYPIFSYEEMRNPFGVHYAVQVKGFPGYVRGIRKIDRVNEPGVNRFPGSLTPLPEGARWKVEIEGMNGAVTAPPAQVQLAVPVETAAARERASTKLSW